MKRVILLAATLCSVFARRHHQPAAADLVHEATKTVEKTKPIEKKKTFDKEDMVYDDAKYGFVFEVVRHGARTPYNDIGLDEFTVSQGMLTPEGMR